MVVLSLCLFCSQISLGQQTDTAKAYARRELDIKIASSRKQKDWKRYTRFLVEKTEKYGYAGTFGPSYELNAIAWEIFLHSKSRKELNKALDWSKASLDDKNQLNRGMDTYANLLYKLGRKKEAIEFEQKALDLEPNDRETQATLAKMKKGEKTWPID